MNFGLAYYGIGLWLIWIDQLIKTIDGAIFFFFLAFPTSISLQENHIADEDS